MPQVKNFFFNKSRSYTVSDVGVLKSPDNLSLASRSTDKIPNFDQSEFGNNDIKYINVSGKVNEDDVKECCDFETAIRATEYGKYNWFILFVALWAYMAAVTSGTTTSYILPSAECDLNLSNFDKGLLNSAMSIGMMISSVLWGVISDSVGRRNVLLMGFLVDAIFTILTGLVQNYTGLVVIKFLEGFVNSSLMALFSSFLAENHSTVYRASVVQGCGIFVSVSNIIQPLLAWLIIPRQIKFVLFNGFISLPTWRIFLLVNAIPGLLAAVGLICLSESPKFLMSQNKNEEALKAFRKMYSWNTGKSRETFAVKSLKNERKEEEEKKGDGERSVREIVKRGFKQVVHIFRKQYLWAAVLTCALQFLTLLNGNTIKLWSPQLFSSSIEAGKLTGNSTTVDTICSIFDLASDARNQDNTCDEFTVDDDVYFNAMITGIVSGVGFLISSYIVNIVDRKWLLVASFIGAVCCCTALYWSTSSNCVLAVISIYLSFTSICAIAITNIVIDLFPTSLRTTAVSLCLTFGRFGGATGNLIFPVLLDFNCAAPFLTLGAMSAIACGLSLLLPKMGKKDLE